jgi:hypothetical protein
MTPRIFPKHSNLHLQSLGNFTCLYREQRNISLPGPHRGAFVLKLAKYYILQKWNIDI